MNFSPSNPRGEFDLYFVLWIKIAYNATQTGKQFLVLQLRHLVWVARTEARTRYSSPLSAGAHIKKPTAGDAKGIKELTMNGGAQLLLSEGEAFETARIEGKQLAELAQACCR